MVDELLDIAEGDDAMAQVAATWLLKAYVKRGRRLGVADVVRLGGALTSLPDGHASLHACQMVAYLELSESVVEEYADFARRCLGSRATFVRAWAVDALYRIASSHPRFFDEAQAALASALSDRAPSIRARARRITQE